MQIHRVPRTHIEYFETIQRSIAMPCLRANIGYRSTHRKAGRGAPIRYDRIRRGKHHRRYQQLYENAGTGYGLEERILARLSHQNDGDLSLIIVKIIGARLGGDLVTIQIRGLRGRAGLQT